MRTAHKGLTPRCPPTQKAVSLWTGLGPTCERPTRWPKSVLSARPVPYVLFTRAYVRPNSASLLSRLRPPTHLPPPLVTPSAPKPDESTPDTPLTSVHDSPRFRHSRNAGPPSFLARITAAAWELSFLPRPAPPPRALSTPGPIGFLRCTVRPPVALAVGGVPGVGGGARSRPCLTPGPSPRLPRHSPPSPVSESAPLPGAVFFCLSPDQLLSSFALQLRSWGRWGRGAAAPTCAHGSLRLSWKNTCHTEPATPARSLPFCPSVPGLCKDGSHVRAHLSGPAAPTSWSVAGAERTGVDCLSDQTCSFSLPSAV